MKIVHVVYRDKFTSDYVNFMKTHMHNYLHFFIISDQGFPLTLNDKDNVFFLKDFVINSKIIGILNDCDLIIFSGIFDIFKIYTKMNKMLQQKSLLHFWGGDFYSYEHHKKYQTVRQFLRFIKRKYYFNRCLGLIFLIEGEYKKFTQIFHIQKRNFVAPMPSLINDYLSNSVFGDLKNDKSKINILLGNSATESNQHAYVIDWLAKYDKDDFNVFVPLSYGEKEYRDYIISYGNNKLGSSFIPIVDYMDFDEYFDFLSTINIGIFNNDRQQAMGNIQILLGMGKKVFLRNDTTMWNRYRQTGYKVFSMPENVIPFSEFINFSNLDRNNNINLYKENESNQKAIEAWENIFNTFNNLTR